MAIGRGIMQVGRINIYPTAASFVSISPPDFTTCGTTVTFSVNVANTKSPFTPIPGPSDGYVSVVDINTGTIIGTSALGVDGNATIVNTLSNGVLWLVAIYSGSKNKFKSSQSLISPYLVNFITTETIITLPTFGTDYCYSENLPITSFTKKVGLEAPYPTSGIVEFKLYFNASDFAILPSATVGSNGHATSYVPAFTIGPHINPIDGYYIQASFDGYECFARSASPIGTAGRSITPLTGDATTTVTSIPSAPLCYSAITTATVTVTAATLVDPSSGTVTLTDMATGNVLGHGTPINGVATIELDGYILPAQIPVAYPYQYTIWADYVPSGICYASSFDHSNTGIGNLLTINKYFASLSAPALLNIADQSRTLDFHISDIISGTGTTGLDGSFLFKLYRADGTFTLTFGSQTVAVAQYLVPLTVLGTIPANTMTAGQEYYVIGYYTPSGIGCYNTTIITSANSLHMFPVA
jgi:hypothetical protein